MLPRSRACACSSAALLIPVAARPMFASDCWTLRSDVTGAGRAAVDRAAAERAANHAGENVRGPSAHAACVTAIAPALAPSSSATRSRDRRAGLDWMVILQQLPERTEVSPHR